jgi:hypothetical protein
MCAATTADARDILLAYDPGFVGFTSVAEMGAPLEPRGDLASAPAVEAIGGTADPDGYYEDFSARLERFVQAYPRLGGGPRRLGGFVVEYDPPPDSDESSSGSDADAAAAADGGPPSAGVLGGCACELPPPRPGPAFSLSDFVIETPPAAPPVVGRGEMDETELERPTFEARRLGSPSILDYAIDT